jgi:hypothetical protein
MLDMWLYLLTRIRKSAPIDFFPMAQEMAQEVTGRITRIFDLGKYLSRIRSYN